MSATLVCLAKPQYTVVIHFAIAVDVEIIASDDFSVGISDRWAIESNISYGGIDLGDFDKGSTIDQELRPASSVSGVFGTLPRVE